MSSPRSCLSRIPSQSVVFLLVTIANFITRWWRPWTSTRQNRGWSMSTSRLGTYSCTGCTTYRSQLSLILVATLPSQVKNLHVLRHMGLQDLRLVIQVRTPCKTPVTELACQAPGPFIADQKFSFICWPGGGRPKYDWPIHSKRHWSLYGQGLW